MILTIAKILFVCMALFLGGTFVVLGIVILRELWRMRKGRRK